MRTFGLFTLAATALLPFVSAAPFNADAAAVANAKVRARHGDLDAKAHADAQVHARRNGVQNLAVTSAASVLTNLHVNLGDQLCELRE